MDTSGIWAPLWPQRPVARAVSSMVLLLLVLSCTSGATFEIHTIPPIDAPAPNFDGNDLATEQRATLGYVFYRGNPMPRGPTDRELRRLDRDFAEAPPVEIEELQGLFGDDRELLVYATRDSDGDGIFDYRVSEYHGKFFEGDLDVDGDGVRNVYDSHPYDPKHGGRDTDADGTPDEPGSFADRDGDEIPDHLDWSRRKADPLPTIQTRLFRDFDVILIERSDRFTPELVYAIDDVLRHMYREPLPTLRTIAIEDQLLLRDDLGDNGLMLAQTQTLTLYAKAIDGAPAIALLGLVAHEVDHAWQLALDFDATQLAKENVRIHYPPGQFAKEVERFGWTVDLESFGGGYAHRLYWPHFYATSPRFQFRGESPRAWQSWIEEIETEIGHGFLEDPRLATRGVIGPYSMTSPWEWHADQLMASLYNRMDRGLASHPNPAVAKSAGLLRNLMLEAVQAQWSRFDYRNAAGSGIDSDFARRFPMSEEELRKLVDRYVVPLADLPTLARALSRNGRPPSIEPEGLYRLWFKVREEVGTPLGEAADDAVQVGTLIRDNVAHPVAVEPDEVDERAAEETGETATVESALEAPEDGVEPTVEPTPLDEPVEPPVEPASPAEPTPPANGSGVRGTIDPVWRLLAALRTRNPGEALRNEYGELERPEELAEPSDEASDPPDVVSDPE